MEHPATRALRESSPQLWRELLLADLVEGEEFWLMDSRDLMVALAPYHDCARRLGLDVPAAFREVAEAGPPGLSEVVVAFGVRVDITPDNFAFALRDGPDGLTYVSTLGSA